MAVGAALVFFAFFHGHTWGISWYDAVIGIVVLPAIMLTVGLVVGHYISRPLRLNGALPTLLNCVVIVALFRIPFTGSAADLFYGMTLLAAGWRGRPGCEATVISNWVLRRDDQIGCPVFSPIDQVEFGHRSRMAPTPGTDLSPTKGS